MPYISLYRKYRPQTFADVVGQEHVTRTLRNAITEGRVASGYLFTGTRGTAKTTCARILAKALNCIGPDGTRTTPNPEPCGQCGPCISIANSSFVDVLEQDAASHGKVDDVRDITGSIKFPPMEGRYKVYIIDEAHQLSRDAMDAFLKTLEEPPDRVVFILATTELDKLPITIASRCQVFEFKRGSVAQISSRLSEVLRDEGVSAQPQAITLIARAADGSYRDSLSLLEQVLAYKREDVTAQDVGIVLGAVGEDTLNHTVQILAAADAAGGFALAGDVLESGRDVRQFLRSLSARVRDLLFVGVGAEPMGAGDLDDSQALRDQAALFSPAQLMHALEILTDAEQETRRNNQHRLLLEMTLLRLMRLPQALSPASQPKVFANTPALPATRQQSAPALAPTRQADPAAAPASASSAAPAVPAPASKAAPAAPAPSTQTAPAKPASASDNAPAARPSHTGTDTAPRPASADNAPAPPAQTRSADTVPPLSLLDDDPALSPSLLDSDNELPASLLDDTDAPPVSLPDDTDAQTLSLLDDNDAQTLSLLDMDNTPPPPLPDTAPATHAPRNGTAKTTPAPAPNIADAAPAPAADAPATTPTHAAAGPIADTPYTLLPDEELSPAITLIGDIPPPLTDEDESDLSEYDDDLDEAVVPLPADDDPDILLPETDALPSMMVTSADQHAEAEDFMQVQQVARALPSLDAAPPPFRYETSDNTPPELLTLQKSWQEVINRMGSRAPSGVALVRDAKPVALHGHTFTLEFTSRFFVDKLAKNEKGRLTIEDVICKTLDAAPETYKIKCVMQGEGTPQNGTAKRPAPAPTTPGPKTQHPDSPLLDEVIAVFGGKVWDEPDAKG